MDTDSLAQAQAAPADPPPDPEADTAAAAPAEEVEGTEEDTSATGVQTTDTKIVEVATTTWPDGQVHVVERTIQPPEDAYEAGTMAVLAAYRRDRNAKEAVREADMAVTVARTDGVALIAQAHAAADAGQEAAAVAQRAALTEASESGADLVVKVNTQRGLLEDLVPTD